MDRQRPAARPDGGGKEGPQDHDNYAVFVTNLPMGRTHRGILVLLEYPRRRGIETAYWQMGEAGPWTTSRSATSQMILLLALLLLHNMWAIEHVRRGTDSGAATLETPV